MSAVGRYLRITGTHTNVGASEETTLQFPSQGGDFKQEIWLLVSLHYVVTGGSAASFELSLGQASGYTKTVGSSTTGDINERLSYSSQTISSDADINAVFAEAIPCLTDSNGRLYLKPGFNTASDNDGNYELWFRRAKGSG